VAGGGSGEVLQLEGGGIRVLGSRQKRKRNVGAELTEEGNGGGASARIRRGRWCFGALDRCTGLVERGRKVPANLGAERGCGMKERGGGHQRLLTERREKGWGPTQAAPRGGRRRGGRAWSRHAEEDGVGEGGPGSRWHADGGNCGQSATAGVGQCRGA
jgi:hypothetical protein